MTSLQPSNVGASLAAIQHHYDISNEFYGCWLDKTFTYSSALWADEDPQDSLELAQQRKIDFMITQARAKGAKRVLDIGCGWGSVLRRLVDIHGVELAVGLTLSEAQAKQVSSFNHPKIRVYLQSWSEHSPLEPYDSIISIGAFEHFARIELSNAERIEAYRNFFRQSYQWLKPGGYMSLQTIAYGNMRREDASQFMNTSIFPESDLPRLTEIAQAIEGIFEIQLLRNDREHYARTCNEWLTRLKASRLKAVSLVGEEVVNRYEHYLKLSTVGFRMGKIALLRLTLRRFDNACLNQG